MTETYTHGHHESVLRSHRRRTAANSAGYLLERRAGGRDSDYASMSWSPDDPLLDRWLDLYRRAARANGGDPDAGRRLLGWAQGAGFSAVAPSASVWCFATPADRAWWGSMWADRITS